ncbi:hypothetical protein J1605_010022 [Eschrichtius robustus]|uniref:U6 snRNA-associated Sm-like protein LSm7 n=1 Tax=Eschrichtius robustus TaxID=9764 RepID=A0AB34GT70_ESCRO|nr:hypothetical protein J1605_010022 [Eschrichtius robustus]
MHAVPGGEGQAWTAVILRGLGVGSRTPRRASPTRHHPDDQYKLTEDTRQLGLVVCRGTSVVLICPQDGMEAIPNPFIQQQDA